MDSNDDHEIVQQPVASEVVIPDLQDLPASSHQPESPEDTNGRKRRDSSADDSNKRRRLESDDNVQRASTQPEQASENGSRDANMREASDEAAPKRRRPAPNRGAAARLAAAFSNHIKSAANDPKRKTGLGASRDHIDKAVEERIYSREGRVGPSQGRERRDRSPPRHGGRSGGRSRTPPDYRDRHGYDSFGRRRGSDRSFSPQRRESGRDSGYGRSNRRDYDDYDDFHDRRPSYNGGGGGGGGGGGSGRSRYDRRSEGRYEGQDEYRRPRRDYDDEDRVNRSKASNRYQSPARDASTHTDDRGGGASRRGHERATPDTAGSNARAGPDDDDEVMVDAGEDSVLY